VQHVNAPHTSSSIAVVGRSLRVPGARSVDEFWANLRAGVESIATLTEEELRAAGVSDRDLSDPAYVKAAALMPDMDRFDAGFFGLSPKDAAIMDPQHRHFLECCWEALEDAGRVPRTFTGTIGVFAGSGMNAYFANNLLTNPELVDTHGLFLLRHTGNDKDFLTTRVSYQFDLRGPSVNVQTACSTSLVAIHLAVQSLLNGECDLALAGGVTIELPHGVGYRYEPGGILSPDGHCRPFGADSRGTVFGSGAGVVVLRRLEDALAERDTVHAVIRGSAANNDGALKVSYLAPSVDGQAMAISEALAMADASPESISYVEAHGTGTPVGDPIEIAALTQAFREGTAKRGYCAIGSVKSNIGHLDTAAGVASFVKVVESLRHRELPPTLHFRSPNAQIDFASTPFRVNDRLRTWDADGGPRRAGVSSLGVGGTNAHVILEEAPDAPASGPSRRCQLIVLSARTPAALERAASRLAARLEDPSLNLADAAFTLQQGREAFPQRRALVCRTAAEAREALLAPAGDRDRPGAAPSGGRRVAFMFAGGGAQYAGMGAELYASEPIYRAEIDRALAVMAPDIAPHVREALTVTQRTTTSIDLDQPSLALPALFAVQHAHARLLISWGVRPEAMIGHSLGEYTAACLAGVFSLEDAVALVSLRGRLFEALEPGAMLNVPMRAEAVEPFLGSDLAIAAVNAPELCVVSGSVAAVDQLERRLAAEGTVARRLHIAVAAHSPMVEPILHEFADFLRTLRFGSPAIPFVSNRSGTWIDASNAASPDYWIRHLRETVHFARGVATLAGDTERVLLEVGPGRTLATLARLRADGGNRSLVLSSMPHADDPAPSDAACLEALGRLWTRGVEIDWPAFSRHEQRRRVSLPAYAFERDRHWIAPGAGRRDPHASVTPAREDVADAPQRRDDVSTWGYQVAWRPAPLSPGSRARGPVLIFADAGGIGDGLRARFAADSVPAVLVKPAAAFHRCASDEFDVRPLEAEDYREVFGALAREGRAPAAILHLWNVTGREAPPAPTTPFDTLFALVKATDAWERGDGARLVVVADGCQEFAGEGLAHPSKALAIGLCSVVPVECEHLATTAIDVQVPSTAAGRVFLIEQLIAELTAASPGDVVAYRGVERFRREFVPVSIERAASIRLRRKGTYLITGGTGGLGLALARHLGTTYGANLALVGRTALPGRDQWPARVAAASANDRTASLISAILDIEAAGGSVMPLTVDLARVPDLEQAVEAVTQRFGAIHGVIHAAGVLADGLIALKDAASVESVLAPKVSGTLALDRAIGDRPLDFFALYSSVSAFAGLPGQSDYAAASAFIDAFARERTHRTGQKTTALAWAPWRDIGMVADAARRKVGSPQSHPLLDRRRTDAIEEFVTSFSTGRHWVIDEHRLRTGQALIPGTGYLEMARAAVDADRSSRCIELSDVFFLTPFLVADGEERSIRLTLDRAGDGAFAISSQADGRGPWVDHAIGVARYVDQTPAPMMPLARLQARCALRDESVTDVVSREHLRLGPRWRNLRRIQYGAGEALLSLSLDDPFVHEASDYGLHPALFDVATAGVQALIEGFGPGDFYVPVSYRRVLVRSALPAVCFSHVRVRPASSEQAGFAAFDVTIYDERGVAIVDVEEFTMKRIEASALLTTVHGRSAAIGPCAGGTPPRPPAHPVFDTLDQAIAPQEGIETFERVVSGPYSPHVIVSPHDLNPWLAWVRAAHRPSPAAPADDAAVPPEILASERALAAHPAVTDAAIAACRDRDGSSTIVAFVVYDREQTATVSELRRHVRGAGPDPVVPAQFIEVASIPRTKDGQVDRGRLPNPFAEDDEYVAPASECGLAIADIWSELLGVARVSGHDNFFDLGGHSLLSVHALARIQRRFGVALAHADMVVNTVDQLAAKCQRLRASAGFGRITREETA